MLLMCDPKQRGEIPGCRRRLFFRLSFNYGAEEAERSAVPGEPEK